MVFASALVWGLQGYLAAGLLFAFAFVWRGVTRVDPAASGSSRGFHLVIVPGVVALWPLLLWRWARRRPPPLERNPHRGREG